MGALLSRESDHPFLMSCQVEEVHNPLLVVSRLVAAGRKVHFTYDDPLSTGQKLAMVYNGGTYEFEVRIGNPGVPPGTQAFARQIAR